MPSMQDREHAFYHGLRGKEPFDVWPGDADRMPPFPFPRLYEDSETEGWKLIKRTSVTTKPGELKLFSLGLTAGHGYSILEFSDFHVVFGEYERVNP